MSSPKFRGNDYHAIKHQLKMLERSSDTDREQNPQIDAELTIAREDDESNRKNVHQYGRHDETSQSSVDELRSALNCALMHFGIKHSNDARQVFEKIDNVEEIIQKTRRTLEERYIVEAGKRENAEKLLAVKQKEHELEIATLRNSHASIIRREKIHNRRTMAQERRNLVEEQNVRIEQEWNKRKRLLEKELREEIERQVTTQMAEERRNESEMLQVQLDQLENGHIQAMSAYESRLRNALSLVEHSEIMLEEQHVNNWKRELAWRGLNLREEFKVHFNQLCILGTIDRYESDFIRMSEALAAKESLLLHEREVHQKIHDQWRRQSATLMDEWNEKIQKQQRDQEEQLNKIHQQFAEILKGRDNTIKHLQHQLNSYKAEFLSTAEALAPDMSST